MATVVMGGFRSRRGRFRSNVRLKGRSNVVGDLVREISLEVEKWARVGEFWAPKTGGRRCCVFVGEHFGVLSVGGYVVLSERVPRYHS